MALQNNAVLVRISIGKFDPKRKNKKAAEEYSQRHGVDAKMHSAADTLVPPEYTEHIGNLAAAARNLVARYTLPWQDRGYRLCPMGQLTRLMDEVAALRSQWKAATDKFIKNYDFIVDEARVRLNGAFDERHYPSAKEITSRFRFEVDYAPVPERGHFVVDSEAEAIAEIVAEEEAKTKDRVADAMQDLRDRLVERLGHLATKCAEYGKDGKKSKMHETTLGNLVELLDDIPRMLVDDDPVLLAAVKQTKDAIDGVDIEGLRNSEEVRKDVAERASKILSTFDF